MKIIHSRESFNPESLKAYLENNLSPLFKKQRQLDVDFMFTVIPDGVQIAQPDMYDNDVLFTIAVVNENELHISKSEHYTNDVNVLTLENVMNNLFLEGSDDVNSVEEE